LVVGVLALQGDYTSYIGVDALIKQPVMDPDYVSVGNYVETLAKGGTFAANRVTPPVLIEHADEPDVAELTRHQATYAWLSKRASDRGISASARTTEQLRRAQHVLHKWIGRRRS